MKSMKKKAAAPNKDLSVGDKISVAYPMEGLDSNGEVTHRFFENYLGTVVMMGRNRNKVVVKVKWTASALGTSTFRLLGNKLHPVLKGGSIARRGMTYDMA